MADNGRGPILIGCLCALGSEVLYGLGYLFTKQATDLAEPFALLGWRFLAAAAGMGLCAALGLVKLRLAGRPLWPLVKLSLVSPCLYLVGETLGIQRTTASESGVLLACIPVVSLMASALLLRQRPTRRQTGGILITLAGVVVTVLAVGASSSLSWTGYGFLVAAMGAYALCAVLVVRAENYASGEITLVMVFTAASVFLPLALVQAAAAGTLGDLVTLPFRSRSFRIAVLGQGLGCSILAFLLTNRALTTIGVNRTASFAGVSTVVSILAGALVLGESFTLWQGLGAAVILLGVTLANSGAPKTP